MDRVALVVVAVVIIVEGRLWRVWGIHLVEVMRLRAHLLLAVERPRRPEVGPRGRRWRWAEEASQVTLAVELVSPGPNTDWEDLGHIACTARPKLRGNLDFERDF